MEVQINEEKIKPTIELEKTVKLILTREEHDQLKSVFCNGKGWSLDYPHTVNVQSVILTGNYKWMPTTNVEFQIEIGGQGKHPSME